MLRLAEVYTWDACGGWFGEKVRISGFGDITLALLAIKWYASLSYWRMSPPMYRSHRFIYVWVPLPYNDWK